MYMGMKEKIKNQFFFRYVVFFGARNRASIYNMKRITETKRSIMAMYSRVRCFRLEIEDSKSNIPSKRIKNKVVACHKKPCLWKYIFIKFIILSTNKSFTVLVNSLKGIM